MKKAAVGKGRSRRSDELRGEYRFDYSKAKPNRFASRVDKRRLVVALDPDVSQVFTFIQRIGYRSSGEESQRPVGRRDEACATCVAAAE